MTLFWHQNRENYNFCAKVVNMTTLIGAKWAHEQLILIFAAYFEGSRGPRVRQDCEQLSGPRGLGGGRGRVNPPPRRLVWRFWEVRVCCWVTTSTRFEAQGLGGTKLYKPGKRSQEVRESEKPAAAARYPIESAFRYRGHYAGKVHSRRLVSTTDDCTVHMP